MRSSRVRRRRSRSVRFVIVAGVTALAVFSAAATAFADTTTPSTDSTTTTPAVSYPAAPTGYADQVVGVYQAEYTTAQALGQSSALLPVSQYSQQIASLGPNELAAMYYATQQVPEFTQIPALMQTIAANSGTGTVGLTSATEGASASSTQLMAMYTPSPREAANTHVATLDRAPVYEFTPTTCQDGPPDASIFAAQIVLDVGQGLYNILTAIQGGIPSIGFIAKIVLAISVVLSAILILAAAIAHDVLSFQKTLADECAGNNSTGYIENIDNTTTQLFSLTTSIETNIADLSTTGATTLTDVQNLQTTLITVHQSLQQSLDSDTSTLQQTVGSSAQGITTQLQTIQTALQQNISAIQALQTTNNQQVVTEVDKGTAAVQAAVAGSVTQALHEIDTTAQGLTNLVSAGNQQILNAMQSNFTTTQNEYNAELKRRIERALGSGVAQVQFKLPASMGGFLNSTPVGVQEVVNDDLHALQALKVTIQPSIVSQVNAANSALAAGQYLSAYASFMKAYQAFAGA
jgi:hypothetical protein